ncbi:hypothetical protein F3Y22_tig00111096pilonHSYRG00082 [Hibiscus syriacus]|uniref:Uncharacterized protein n=1 Tax=Hibiscus syriacus TaxID=106335 RepID=A0A6A2Z244_HIBSY|nr:hypothetical protein F3Y22_tig00111096pilonHSYRG00082 [Hibiscus syriacus]
MAAKLGIHVLSIFSMFFVALSNNMTVIPEQLTFGHPLCRSQIALVNFACDTVPILPMPPPVDGHEHRSHWPQAPEEPAQAEAWDSRDT